MSGGEDKNKENLLFSNVDYMTGGSIRIFVNVAFTRWRRHVSNKLSFPMV